MLTCFIKVSQISSAMGSPAPLQSSNLGNVQPNTNTLVRLAQTSTTHLLCTIYKLTDA